MTELPEKLRVTLARWSEEECCHKIQLGDSHQTVAYVWVPGGFGDKQAVDKANAIATRICEGWNND
jgi:hypothetical protein